MVDDYSRMYKVLSELLLHIGKNRDVVKLKGIDLHVIDHSFLTAEVK